MKPWREFYREYMGMTEENEAEQPGHTKGLWFLYTIMVGMALAWVVSVVRG